MLTHVQQANQFYIEKVVGLAESFRVHTLKSFCERYKIDFISGMGQYFFHCPSGSFFITTASDVTGLALNEILQNKKREELSEPERFVLRYPGIREEIEDIFAVLDRELLDGYRLGHHVQSLVSIPF